MPDAAIDFRPMTDGDLGTTRYVAHHAMDWLAQQQNMPRRPFRPGNHAWSAMLLREGPECCWVAEIHGTPIGYAMGFVRGNTYFLSQLFVHPDMHGQKAGSELLRRSMDGGRARGAEIFSVVASTSLIAQSLYTRAGMHARGTIYYLQGATAALLTFPEPSAQRKRVVDCSGWQDQMAALDRDVWGAERRPDHNIYLSRDSYGKGETYGSFALMAEGKLTGYAYAFGVPGSEEPGTIGPAAAIEPEEQLPLLRLAGEWLTEHKIEHSRASLLSHNATVIGALLAAGWQIEGSNVFMASAPFGRFDRYIPAGGGAL